MPVILMVNNKKKKRSGNYKRKWDTKTCKQFIRDSNIDVELLSEYIDSYEKMIFRCSCGNIFETNWHEFNNKKFPKRQCNNGIRLIEILYEDFLDIDTILDACLCNVGEVI